MREYTHPRKQEWSKPEPVDLPKEFKWASWKAPPPMLFGATKTPILPKAPVDFTQAKLPTIVFSNALADPEWLAVLRGILSRMTVVGHRYVIKIEHTPWVSFIYKDFGRYGAIDTKMYCMDRDSPSHQIWVSNPVPIPEEITEESVTNTVREAIKLLMTHEVDECLRFDGVRKWDPHPTPPPMVKLDWSME